MRTVFKSVFRNFVRRPVINLINLLGLSVSLALVIILSVYCYSELTTDNFHKNGDRVYLFGELNKELNKQGPYMPGILKEHIDLNVPEVESTVRMASTWEVPVFQTEGKEPITSDIIFADEDFFELFTYKVVEGDLMTALKEPLSVVITKTLSGRLFGTENPINRTIKLNNDKELTVKAVIEEPESNSCLSFSAVTSIATRKIVMSNESEFNQWKWGAFQTFVLLKKGADPKETAQRIFSLFPKEVQKEYEGAKLNPLKEVYFSQLSLSYSDYLHSGDQKKVMILLLVAALVLMIAVVNFINISWSQWLEKIKRTGVMKIIGASRLRLLLNILLEAFSFFFLSFLFAIILIRVTTRFICDYTGIQFNQQLIYSPYFFFVSIAGIFILSIIFSLIPALQISSSRAIDNLKKTVDTHIKKSKFRGILVVAQFTIAIILITSTILIQKQVNYGSNNLGFSQENIIGIKLTPELDAKKEALKQFLLEKPIIEKISFTQYYPGNLTSHRGAEVDFNGEKNKIDFDTFSADASFFEMMGLDLIMGRFYSENNLSDANKIVVNETFTRKFNMQNPIGAKLLAFDGSVSEIIGVVKDFHYKSFNKQITSLVIRNERKASYCIASIKTSDYDLLYKSVQEIQKATSNLSPSFPVEISFFDQAVENMYRSELQFRRIFSLFAGSAIMICCMGILAISLFSCQYRIKEIGVRKINGARVSEVMLMLNKDFVKWVVIAFVIATPIAYFVMLKWLESFAYKTELSWWIFALAGLLSLGIALLTVSWQSWKAATRNPVEALRYE